MDESTAQELVEIRPKGAYSEVRTCKTLEEFLDDKRMPSESVRRSVEARRRFLELLGYPEFHEISNQEKADAIGISIMTFQRWMIQVPDEVLAESLKRMRERFARQSFKVDSALLEECKKGNVKAMDLYYRRIEGWVPKQDMELTRGRDKELDGKANFELLKELVKGLSPSERAELLGPQEIEMSPNGVVEGNVERLEGGVKGGDDVRMG